MLNRKEKLTHRTGNQQNGHARKEAVKAKPIRRRFIISPKAAAQMQASAQQHPEAHRGRPAKADLPAAKAGSGPAKPGAQPTTPVVPGQPIDLTETIKTLLHLARENGHVTYDDIN